MTTTTRTTYPTSRPTQKVVPFGVDPRVSIIIDPTDLDKFFYLVSQVAPNEVQWFSFVNRQVTPGYSYETTKHGKKTSHWAAPHYRYFVSGMLIPKQEVHGTEVDTDPSSDPMKMLVLYQELKQKHTDEQGNIDMDAVNSDIQRMHVWSHSHPFSSGYPGPSGTDTRNFASWVENNASEGHDSPMIMLIFSKSNDSSNIYARVYDPRLPHRYYEHVPVTVEPRDIDTAYMDEAIENKIVSAPKSYRGNYGNWSYNPASGQSSYSSVSSSSKTSASSSKDKEDLRWEKRRQSSYKTFDRKHNGKQSFEQLWESIMTSSDNSSDVIEAWQAIKSHMEHEGHMSIFTLALADEKGELDDMLISGIETEMMMNEDECLVVLLDLLKTQMFYIEEVTAALVLARRYFGKDTEEHRRHCVTSYNQQVYKICDYYNPSKEDDSTQELEETALIPYIDQDEYDFPERNL